MFLFLFRITYHNFDLEAFGLKRKVLEGTVLDLGDENYAWEDSNDRRTTGIDFRKGKVFVHITAATMEFAKEFAFLIAEALPARTFLFGGFANGFIIAWFVHNALRARRRPQGSFLVAAWEP